VREALIGVRRRIGVQDGVRPREIEIIEPVEGAADIGNERLGRSDEPRADE
jgi:hypothetical protein